ncbi:hypothetical protein C7212DRAFT_343197 [Tuber magnatum]|uniref:Uncharacterized protein n=1 Tax=Tuber magnatum TaxID=42249 RepID=A0A317SYX4_9PEZI|nr:hypothetical protein C7212DRAFT_343197 [Tuber magnatum]
MITVGTSIGESLMFIRLAKLTPRFEDDDDLVVSTKEIAESYQERQIKDGRLEPALATMVAHLRMCIWEVNYIDWLATVIYRAKYSKFFREPSKATRLQARYLAQAISIRSDSGATTPGLDGKEQASQTGLFRRACAELNRSESAVYEAIQQCINRKASKDVNDILILEKTKQWGELYERILRDTRHLKECIPTQFIPFHAYVRGALEEFTRAYSSGCISSGMKPGAGSTLARKQPSENRRTVQTGNKTGTGAPVCDENEREMREDRQVVDVESGGLENGGNIGRGPGPQSWEIY